MIHLDTIPKCPIHDCLVDPETGCDYCARDQRLDCPDCGGEGVIITRHPRWGHVNCPTPELETPCGCGSGWGLPDVECDMCHKRLMAADPAWSGHIVNGQVLPLCVDCAVLAGFTREGVQ